MTTNFTFRDFLVYLLTGLTLILSVSIIFWQNLFTFSLDFFTKYEFIKEFAFLVTIFLIPLIYLLGHLVGSTNYFTLQLFIWLDKKIKRIKNGVTSKKELNKLDKLLIIILQRLLYRHRVVYEIINYTKTTKEDKLLFKSVDDFWTLCAKLQIEKIYSSAEYWYVLNDLFKSVNLVFAISTAIAFIFGHWCLGLIYFFLMLIAFGRARQYSNFFVKTVCRLVEARKTTQIGK